MVVANGMILRDISYMANDRREVGITICKRALRGRRLELGPGDEQLQCVKFG